jgi:transposase
MHCVIFTRGGLLIMMGRHARSEPLFYYFKLDDYVPKNHLLRLIDEHVIAFVRERLKDSYSDTGRLSIDPELLLHRNRSQDS